MLFFPNNKIFLRKSVIFARFFAFYRKKYHIFDSFCYFSVVHIRRCWLLWYQQISSCMWLVYWQRLYVSELYSFISMNWTCRTSSSSQKSADFWEPCLIGYLCGSSPMKKTILDLLHSNESKRNTIYSITQRYIRLNKNKGLVEPLVLIYILRINHQSYRT